MSLTPPVSRDNFHYSNGELYVTSTNQNRHRRATLPELQALFHPAPGQTAPKDPPAHWYKAQLLHYGLQPSDVKGTAVKRLLDAVNGGSVEVPAHIRRLELDLKKEWEGNERKDKRELANSEKKGGASGAGKKSNKRKADGDDGATAASVNVGGMNFNFNFNFAGGSPSATVTPDTAAASSQKAGNKRAKTGDKDPKGTQSRQAAKSQPKTEPKPKPEPKARKETPAKREPKTEPKPKPEPKARKEAPVKREPKTEPKPKPEPKVKKEAPVKREPMVKREQGVKPEIKNESPAPFSSPSSARGPSLGLLNGVYEIDAYDLEDTGRYENYGCRITLCLDRKTLWGEFEFCGLHGVMFFPERPWAASPNSRIGFTYCGYDDVEGVNLTNDSNSTGWVTFLGNGQIEGCFEDLAADPYYGDALNVRIRGYRISGQETRPPRDAYSMQDEWNQRHEDF